MTVMLLRWYTNIIVSWLCPYLNAGCNLEGQDMNKEVNKRGI